MKKHENMKTCRMATLIKRPDFLYYRKRKKSFLESSFIKFTKEFLEYNRSLYTPCSIYKHITTSITTTSSIYKRIDKYVLARTKLSTSTGISVGTRKTFLLYVLLSYKLELKLNTLLVTYKREYCLNCLLRF